MKFGEVINFHKLGGKENDMFELNSSSAQYIYQVKLRTKCQRLSNQIYLSCVHHAI
jgi:hypothetical protein